MPGEKVVGTVVRTTQGRREVFAYGVNGWYGCSKHPVDPEEVRICRLFLRARCRSIKTVCMHLSSYGFKHEVERWCRERGEARYISNGAFIVAASLEGFIVYAPSTRTPNAYFNISKRRKEDGSVRSAGEERP